MIRVQRQDRAAFAVLVDRHLEAIHAFNFRFLRNAEDAADLAQEAFLRVWNSAGTYRPGRVKFTTWLHRIARNLCIDLHRRRKNTEPLNSAVCGRRLAAGPGASGATSGCGRWRRRSAPCRSGSARHSCSATIRA